VAQESGHAAFCLMPENCLLYIIIPVENGRFIVGLINGSKYIDKFSSFFQILQADKILGWRNG